jgi:hypothetical protein
MLEEWRLRFPERHRPERGAPETERLLDAWIAGFAKHHKITCAAVRAGSVEQECTWTYNPDGYWQTSCDDQFMISNEQGPIANGMKFCHHCGLRIVVPTVHTEGIKA